MRYVIARFVFSNNEEVENDAVHTARLFRCAYSTSQSTGLSCVADFLVCCEIVCVFSSKLVSKCTMSDEAEDVKKKVALAMAAVTDAEVELEAPNNRQQLFGYIVLASSSFHGPREVWAFTQHRRWFEETVANLGDQNFRQSFNVSQTTLKYLVVFCRPTMERRTTNMHEAIPVHIDDD